MIQTSPTARWRLRFPSRSRGVTDSSSRARSGTPSSVPVPRESPQKSRCLVSRFRSLGGLCTEMTVIRLSPRQPCGVLRMLGSVVGKSGSAGAAHSTFASLRWTQGVRPRGVVLEEAAGRNDGVLLRRLGRHIEPMEEPHAEVLEEGRAAPATAPECARSAGRASRPTLVPPHRCPSLCRPVSTGSPRHRLAIASPSPRHPCCPHRIPIFSPPRPDKVPAASCLCTSGRWSAPSRFVEGGRTRAAAGLRSEGSGTSPTGATRRRARRRRGELKGIGAGRSRAPRRQVSGYLVGGPLGQLGIPGGARVLPAWVPPGRLPIRAEGDVPESRRRGEWARPTDERRARARESLRPERPCA